MELVFHNAGHLYLIAIDNVIHQQILASTIVKKAITLFAFSLVSLMNTYISNNVYSLVHREP